MTSRERVNKWNDNFYRWYNFNDSGFTYVVVGNTYEIKDELKKRGAKYCRELGWTFDRKVMDFKSEEIYIDDVAYKDETGRLHFKPNVEKFIRDIKSKYIEPSKSEWVGEIGDTDVFMLTLVKTHQFSGVYGLTTVYTFNDENENVIIWMTSKDLDIEIGDTVRVCGKIKSHRVFNNEKQTYLTRCRVENEIR